MEKMINVKTAFRAMHEFLRAYYFRNGKPDEIGLLLGDTQILPSGYIADSASWQDWLKAVEKVIQEPDLDNFKT